MGRSCRSGFIPRWSRESRHKAAPTESQVAEADRSHFDLAEAFGRNIVGLKMNRLVFVSLALVIAPFSACTRDAPSGQTDAPTAASSSTSAYGKRLLAAKTQYPFSRWSQGGPEQYTASACSKFTAIFDELIAELMAAGESAPESQKLSSFHRAVTALNDLNRRDPRLIETSEAEELCGLGNVVAAAAGLDPKKYGHGEGPISEGRDW